NVESLIWRRYHEAEPNPLKRWFVRRQWLKFERFEQWAYSEASAAIAVSSDDAELMQRRFGIDDVAVVENGVDTAYFRPQRDIDRDPARLLFLGSLDWRPNLDAIRLLLDTIFPRVKRQVPNATLALVGRHPPDWLRTRAARDDGVELHANVADVRPFLASCGMLVVPLRIGGGSRLKILEALAGEVPVVSTRVGAEGLCLEPGEHLTVVEDVDDLVPALVAAVRNPGAARARAVRGRQRVLERYDWDVLAGQMEQAWVRCVTRHSKPGAQTREIP